MHIHSLCGGRGGGDKSPLTDVLLDPLKIQLQHTFTIASFNFAYAMLQLLFQPRSSFKFHQGPVFLLFVKLVSFQSSLLPPIDSLESLLSISETHNCSFLSPYSLSKKRKGLQLDNPNH